MAYVVNKADYCFVFCSYSQLILGIEFNLHNLSLNMNSPAAAPLPTPAQKRRPVWRPGMSWCGWCTPPRGRSAARSRPPPQTPSLSPEQRIQMLIVTLNRNDIVNELAEKSQKYT